MNKTAKLGLISVASFVIANMIGAGVFTSLGYQLQSINNPYSILMLWVVGGVLALCGALVYGELGAAMPRSGGEYHYLGKIYHPVLGFLSGWVSLTVGFAAPVALSSMGAGRYLSMVFPELSQTWTALTVLTIVTAIHCYTIQFGGKFQTLFTSINIGLILIFIFAGCLYTPQVQNTAAFASAIDWNEMISPAFAVSLIYVSFAYSGWNAAAYIAGDIDNPRHTLPRSLFISTMVVMVLYVMLNLVFMLTAPIAEMKGQMEIGFISATHLFGISGGRIMGGFIALMLISSVSSMAFVGPRVSQTMGEDIHILKFLSFKSGNNIPVPAILLQYAISVIMILSAGFEQVMKYSGFTLNLFTFMTVLGLFVHRIRFRNDERPYRTWGFPVVPLIFLLLIGWTLYFLMIYSTRESLIGLATVLSGLVFYFLNDFVVKRKKKHASVSENTKV